MVQLFHLFINSNQTELTDRQCHANWIVCCCNQEYAACRKFCAGQKGWNFLHSTYLYTVKNLSKILPYNRTRINLAITSHVITQ